MTGVRREVWDRLDTESPKAFAAFVVYRDMTREDRSVLAAYRVRSGRAQAENLKPPGTWYRWNERHQWEDRSRAWDSAQDRRVEAGLANRRLKSLQEIADLGEQLRRKASAAARMLVGVTQKVGQIDGREAVILEVKMTPGDICAMAKTGAALESLALGLPTDRTSQQDGGSDQVAISVNEAKAEMARRLSEIRARHEQAKAIEHLLEGG